MSKVLLEVYLPVALKTFDVVVPADMRLDCATELIAKALSQATEGLYVAGEAPLLCDRASGNILNINMTVQEIGLRNGSCLMLI